MIVVHVTHEAVEKIGGIGTVIDGLTTAKAYQRQVSRTVLLGPLFSTDKPVNQRLGEGGRILYSSLDEVDTGHWREKFLPIERTYDVGIVYGLRRIREPYSGRVVDVEALVLDVFHANQSRLNLFKGELYEKFDIASSRFEDIWDYEQYTRLAEPGYEALRVIGAIDPAQQTVLISHEYMGMPTALRAILAGEENIKTVFHAHEVASVRPIVEKHPGHDTMFYNVMEQATRQGQTLEDVFPQVQQNYKHPLVKAARYCDFVFAVGDYIVEELQFLDRHFKTMGVDLVYNGIPHDGALTIEDRNRSNSLLRQYAAELVGFEPTWIATHVARPVLSKGIWRDVRILHEMEPLLADRGETMVYFMLGTLGGQRRIHDVRQMERVYGWPMQHEHGYPDLCGGEEVVFGSFDVFNRSHQQSRAVLVNQWGFSPKVCGDRMPKEMTIADLRRGSDLEFGLSVYEPFGISQFEPLSYGAMCAVSNVCGCMGFARQAMRGGDYDNVIEGNFLGVTGCDSLDDRLSLSMPDRDRVEAAEARRLAAIIVDRLPRDPDTLQRRMRNGGELSGHMSWERVVEDYFLPSLGRAVRSPAP
jgi:hypothetical protein